MTDKQKTCCFTGHRPDKLPFGYDEGSPGCLRLKVSLIGEIDKMRNDGVTTFLTGMAQGIDLIAAELVLDVKRAYPEAEIRLVAVVPFEGQANRWTEKYRDRYFTVLSKADEVVTLQKRYTVTCLQERTRYMLNASSRLIAVYNGARGDTKYAVDYAIKNGLDVVIINPDTLKRDHLPPSEPILPFAGKPPR